MEPKKLKHKLNKKKKPLGIKNKILNTLMKSGKKTKSEIILLKSIKKLQKSETINHIDLFKHSIISSSSFLKTVLVNKKKKRKKKKLFEIPFLIDKTKRIPLGIKNCFMILKKKKMSGYKTLIHELLQICKNLSNINKIVEELHLNALQYKKFIKFKWF